MKILRRIIYELMVGYGQFLSTLVGFCVIPVIAILLAIALPNLKKNHDLNSWALTLLVFFVVIGFHSYCIYLGQKALKDEKKFKSNSQIQKWNLYPFIKKYSLTLTGRKNKN